MSEDANARTDLQLAVNDGIKKYSDHISHSIYLRDIKDEAEEKANDGNALWMRNKKDIKPSEYENFYSPDRIFIISASNS